MKTMMTLAVLMLGTTAAVAGPFGLPDHQQNGFRDTGCDPAQQVAITNDAGEVLYWNNPSCKGSGGGSNVEALAGLERLFPAPKDEDEDEEVASK